LNKYIFLILVVVILGYQKSDDISRFFIPPPDYAAAHDVKVVMYGASWCVVCARAREFLEDNEITYYEYDVETSREGAEQYISLGGTGAVPLLQINRDVVKGYDEERILELVGGIQDERLG
jgi:mycoredoxin